MPSFVLVAEIAAVKLNRARGSLGPVHRIPARSVIRTLGTSALDGMVDVEWHGENYAVFPEDLERRSAPESDGGRFRRLNA